MEITDFLPTGVDILDALIAMFPWVLKMISLEKLQLRAQELRKGHHEPLDILRPFGDDDLAFLKPETGRVFLNQEFVTLEDLTRAFWELSCLTGQFVAYFEESTNPEKGLQKAFDSRIMTRAMQEIWHSGIPFPYPEDSFSKEDSFNTYKKRTRLDEALERKVRRIFKKYRIPYVDQRLLWIKQYTDPEKWKQVKALITQSYDPETHTCVFNETSVRLLRLIFPYGCYEYRNVLLDVGWQNREPEIIEAFARYHIPYNPGRLQILEYKEYQLVKKVLERSWRSDRSYIFTPRTARQLRSILAKDSPKHYPDPLYHREVLPFLYLAGLAYHHIKNIRVKTDLFVALDMRVPRAAMESVLDLSRFPGMEEKILNESGIEEGTSAMGLVRLATAVALRILGREELSGLPAETLDKIFYEEGRALPIIKVIPHKSYLMMVLCYSAITSALKVFHIKAT